MLAILIVSTSYVVTLSVAGAENVLWPWLSLYKMVEYTVPANFYAFCSHYTSVQREVLIQEIIYLIAVDVRFGSTNVRTRTVRGQKWTRQLTSGVRL